MLIANLFLNNFIIMAISLKFCQLNLILDAWIPDDKEHTVFSSSF
jgi:hypothetical protein